MRNKEKEKETPEEGEKGSDEGRKAQIEKEKK